jgi:hypothetical protein
MHSYRGSRSLANGKVLTRDKLAKRRHVRDQTSLFYSDFESVQHIFFECCVAKIFWQVVTEIAGIPAISDFMSLDKWWLHGKKMGCLNVLTIVALWTI